MSEDTMQPQAVFQRLAGEGAAVVLVGGLAAAVLGVPYVTNDIDLCYDPDSANLARLVAALAPLHPRLRVEGLSDEEATALPFHLDVRTLQQASILTLQTNAGKLDLMSAVPGLGSYEQVRAASIDLELEGITVPTLDLPGLIASKRAAGRPKDLLALPQIEATLRLRDQPPP
jgi:hypothetical protein